MTAPHPAAPPGPAAPDGPSAAPRPSRAPAGLPPRAPGPALTHLLYLHGFRSSPASFKARRLAGQVAALQARGRPLHWACPALPDSPTAALAGLRSLVEGWPAASSAVVGSSLGGFYAGLLAQALGWRAVLLNPAVEPSRSLARQLGIQPAWHEPDRPVQLTGRDVEDLAALEAGRRPPGPTTLAVIATGDEVLDPAAMLAHTAGATRWVVEGGDHALSDFEPVLAALQHFLGLDEPGPAGA